MEFNQNISPGDTLMIAFDTYSAGTGESRLPNSKVLGNRSEFLLSMVAGEDSALYCVTEAYDMKGLLRGLILQTRLYRSTAAPSRRSSMGK